jgi:type I restriction enzyme M protein
VVKTIYDPACGTGGMLSVAEKYIRDLNSEANPLLFGQDWNDEAWAVCKSDMLIKGEDADNIILGDTFSKDGFADDKDGKKITFDYMLANPPFGVEWKQQATFIEKEHKTLGHHGRFGAGLPRINDGALLFLQHMLSKRRVPEEGGSRIGIVFNGSPLFTGDAGSGESNIRQWIIENDWLEAIVALPDQLFYNTGISTYLWILTNRKERERNGKIQLIDARQFYVKMRKSLGNKRNKIGDKDENEPDQIGEITRIFGNFQNGETRNFTTDGNEKSLIVSKIFDNADFGYHKITVERPLRLNFQATEDRIARLEEESAFKNLASSNKKNERVRIEEIELGKDHQEKIRELLRAFSEKYRGTQTEVGEQYSSSMIHEGAERYASLVTPAKAGVQSPPNLDAGSDWPDGHLAPRLYKDRKTFIDDLKSLDNELGVRLTAAEFKAVLNALGERDETAEICRDRDGNPEPDPELRDTETVPLKQSIEEYFKREVLPHVPDAWIDESKTKVGYEIPLNRHFYRYEPPRPLEEIEADIKTLEGDILALLKEVAA